MLVSGAPATGDPRPASSPVLHDAGPLRLLWHWRQQSALALVRQSSGSHLAQVAVAASSSRRGHMGPLQRLFGPAPTACSQDLPWLRHRERTSLVKNRMLEICTSGTVRGGAGNDPTYSAFELAQCGEEGFEGCRLGEGGLVGEELEPPGLVGGGQPFQEQTAEQA